MTASPHGSQRFAVTMLTAAALLTLITALAVVRPASLDPALTTPLSLALGFLPVGFFLYRHRPDAHLARSVWAVGVLATVATATIVAVAWPPARWAAQWMWWPPLALLPVTLIHFPRAPDPGSRGARASTIALAATFVTTTVLALAALIHPEIDLSNPRPNIPRVVWVAYVLVGLNALLALTLLGGRTIVLARTALHARTDLRQQCLCLLPCAILIVLGLPLEAAGVPFALVPAIVALPLGYGVAIVQFNYDDLGRRVAREVVRAGLVVVMMAVIAGIVIAVSAIAGPVVPVWSCLLAVVAAMALDTPRKRGTALVDRWLFGHRSDPYRVLSLLNDQMQAAPSPAVMLHNTTSMIVTLLAIPYARITMLTETTVLVLAESGRPVADTVAFPLRMPGHLLGHLEIAPRRIGESLASRDRQLFAQIAGQAAFAVYAHQLTTDLRSAREVLVFSREEERLRLRRDLHDGLGPVLAGARMQLTVAAGLLPPGESTRLIRAVLDELGNAGRTVRELIDGLRPGALDLGLVAAIEQATSRILAGIASEVDVPRALPVLPPAVETAALRIAEEAMHNVIRHAGADRCRISLTTEGAGLTLTITDDGTGIAPNARPGVGLASMSRRADELGGVLMTADASPGTRITAVLPLAAPITELPEVSWAPH